MAVIYPDERREWWAPPGDQCFFCGNPVEPREVAVMWCSPAGKVILHAACAAELGMNLIGDAREARLAAGVGPWGNRRRGVLVYGCEQACGRNS